MKQTCILCGRFVHAHVIIVSVASAVPTPLDVHLTSDRATVNTFLSPPLYGGCFFYLFSLD